MTISRKFGSRKVQRLTEASSLRAVKPTNLIFNTKKLWRETRKKIRFLSVFSLSVCLSVCLFCFFLLSYSSYPGYHTEFLFSRVDCWSLFIVSYLQETKILLNIQKWRSEKWLLEHNHQYKSQKNWINSDLATIAYKLKRADNRAVPKTPENLRIWLFCYGLNEVEHELHFLFNCNLFDSLRSTFYRNISNRYPLFNNSDNKWKNPLHIWQCRSSYLQTYSCLHTFMYGI